MKYMVLSLVSGSSLFYAQALPVGPDSDNSNAVSIRVSAHLGHGTTTEGRLAYGLVSFACLFAMSFILGLRTKNYERKKLNFGWLLVNIQTVVAIGLVISSSILVVSLGTTTQRQCYGAIMVCVAFYTTAKFLLYLFLLERAHIARAPFLHKRTDDRIWVGGTIFLSVSFGTITIWSYITFHSEINNVDGQCHIGLDRIPAYLLLAFDIFTNIALTVVFFILLRPFLEFRAHMSAFHADSPPSGSGARNAIRKIKILGFKQDESMDNFQLKVKRVLWENVIGSSVTCLVSAGNLTVYFVDKNIELAVVCLITCMVDVTFGVLVVQWLTLGSEDDLQKSRSSRSNSTTFSPMSTVTTVPANDPGRLSKGIGMVDNEVG